ncbi:MAG TPA: hypothetical protein VD861_22185 [Pyrinomonadaceae bacterium]|nr:hypothetical protein [Pyrinomonadaceae bacterium]
MKTLSRLMAGVCFGLLCAVPLTAQEPGPRPDGWRGLVLNVSAPEDAIRVLGAPSKDKDRAQLDTISHLEKWLGGKQKEKVFRTLTFKKPLPGLKQAKLSFLDGKLVSIHLEGENAELKDEWIDPDDLEEMFGATFKPQRRKFGDKLPPPAEFQANAPAELKKDEYAYWYDLIAVTENSFIYALADNYKYIDGLFESPDTKRRKQINARGEKFPGYVTDIQIISRALAAR